MLTARVGKRQALLYRILPSDIRCRWLYSEIDSQDKLLLKYSDVEGEREYEHDTLNMPTPRFIVCMKRAQRRVRSRNSSGLRIGSPGTRHYQADMARFFEKHLNRGGN